ncbi:MAG: DUF4149 domain-containing protein [Pseudomonadota bacterium]|nr:DUF4149 domain-containing protein [Pseudomonadota bacterium]
MTQRLALLATALWWGSLPAIGFMAVPLLFKHLPTPAMAGQMAARLFTAQTWLSVACGVTLLLCMRKQALAGEEKARAAIVFIVLGLLLALLVEFGVAPRIVARQNLPLWHSLGTGMYALQWLCAGWLLCKIKQTPACCVDDAARLPSRPSS